MALHTSPQTALSGLNGFKNKTHEVGRGSARRREEGRKGTGSEGWKGGFEQNTLYGPSMVAFHPALRKQKKVGFCELEANLVSIVSFRPAGAIK